MDKGMLGDITHCKRRSKQKKGAWGGRDTSGEAQARASAGSGGPAGDMEAHRTVQKIPLEWKRGLMAPFFKKGDNGLPQNYKSLCMLPYTRKVIEAAIAKRMAKMVPIHTRQPPIGTLCNENTN